jgi:hypothetical protein
VGYSSAQHLEVGANAVLKQIADAMNNTPLLNGIKLLDPSDPRGTMGFCEVGCVVISHSDGAPVTDVAMALAADLAYQNDNGPIGFIPAHMKVHAALGGAFSGSQWATDVMVLAYGLGLGTYYGPVCALAQGFLGLPNSSFCNSLNRLRDSLLWDTVPQVMQSDWIDRIITTPVPVLTVAGASDHYNWPFKFFFQRGFDDGVVSMDSACARNTYVLAWPSGFFEAIPGGNLLDPRLFDMGMHTPGHPGRNFAEQNYEFAFSFPPLDVFPRAAGACAPQKTPWGMVEKPIGGYNPFPILQSGDTGYYHNHYSFVQTAEDHFDLLERTDAPRWDSHAVLSSDVYTHGMVNTAFEKAQYQLRRGLPLYFKCCGGIQFGPWWIWHRDYHLLNGTDQLAAADYVYDYVN